MRKLERVENALRELEQIRGNIEIIRHEIDQLEWLERFPDAQDVENEKALEQDLREEHIKLESWTKCFLGLMRNNEKYFSESGRE